MAKKYDRKFEKITETEQLAAAVKSADAGFIGLYMAECVDVAILVGKKHTAPIADGLKESGFPDENLHVVSSLEEAAALLRQIGHAGDVALFENDLPDNYSEV